MTKAVAQNFLDLVKRSQLVEEDQLSKFLATYQEKHGEPLPEDQHAIAQALVESKLLTDWQSEKLLAGKHRGFMLGKYKLLGQLGKGGMSTVYLAEHIMMKARRAIKVLPRNRVEDSTYLERFRIEARAAAKLDDPNIVRAYDIDQEGETHFIVMEYVDGKDLHQTVKEHGPLGFYEAADYIAQAASGLAHAHEMDLVHRDIKPANLLLDRNKTIKLLDLGLARLIGDEASLTLDNNENVLGTADYLAPEQALNSHKADSRSDIYSLGCTLYFLLTGHPPFPEGSISERLLKHQVEMAPSILKDRPDTPPTLLHICEKMMSKDPKNRYPSANDVAERLREWLADHGREVGDSGKKTDGGSGVGSDVFRRFAQSINRAGESGSIVGRSPASSPKSGVRPSADDDEEDYGLAPLEEEALEDDGHDFGSDLDGDLNGRLAESSTDDLTKASSETFVELPHRSLVEEAFEVEANKSRRPDPAARLQPHPGGVNPLRPPGFSGPSYGPPVWLYVLIGLGVLGVIGVIAAVVF